MSSIVVFGAAGRAGRRIVQEARRRGHDVVAVVRDPAAYADPDLVAGDVTDPASVRGLVTGRDVVVSAVARMDVPSEQFYAAATNALVEGIGAGRLVTIGIGSTLETAPGVRVMDDPGFRADARAFSQGHLVELELLAATPDQLDWVVMVPPPVMLADEAAAPVPVATSAGTALVSSAGEGFSYADLAAAVLDEIEVPRHHRTPVAVTRAP